MAEMPPEPEALLEHRAFLRVIAKGLLRDEDAAEDVAQDALLAAMERPPKGPNLKGWLGAVARNLARMARRGERRRAERERRAARPEATAPADEAMALLEVQRKVVEAVLALEEPYRTAIVLHYFHDLPVRDLALRLRVDAGEPVPDVNIRIEHGAGSSFGLTDPKGRADMTVTGRVRKIHPPDADGYGDVDPITDLPDGIGEARFTLPRWEEILGLVVDEAGAPLAGAIVEVRWGAGEPRKVSTSGHGKFHVSVPPGTVVELRVVGKYAPAPGMMGMMEGGGLVSEVQRVAAGSRDVAIRATVPRRDATLRVRVLTPDGKPRQRAIVTYQPQPMENRVTVETDADGRAVLADLPAAEIGVSAWFDPRRVGFMFPLVQKVTPRGQEVVLKCREAVRLKGIVVDPEGKPRFAQVFALHEGQMFDAFADKQGRFELLVPADAESLDLQAAHKTPDGEQLHGYVKHRLADGEARIVVKPPE